jgi:hypothetical protein
MSKILHTAKFRHFEKELRYSNPDNYCLHHRRFACGWRFAAPVMLHLPKIEGDTSELKNTFNLFHFWGLLHAVAQILSFIFSVITLSEIYKLNIDGSGLKFTPHT